MVTPPISQDFWGSEERLDYSQCVLLYPTAYIPDPKVLVVSILRTSNSVVRAAVDRTKILRIDAPS